MRKIFFVSLLLAGVSLSSAFAGPASKGSKNLRVLTEWMSGQFNSKDHHKRDSLIAPLEMRQEVIWENLVTDGIWMYAELKDTRSQMVVSQKFFKFSDLDEKQMEMTVYSISNVKDFEGELSKDKPFNALRPDDLALVEDCAVIFSRKTEQKFQGTTTGTDCKSGSRRASYIIQDFQVFENKVVWLENGFDSEQKIIWGPVAGGGYQFKRDLTRKK
jgi:hypothetical protein